MKRFRAYTAAAFLVAAIILRIPVNSITITNAEAPINRAALLDNYFTVHKMPLAGYGSKFVAAADLNNLDWRLLPAIAIQESTGGRFECGKNPFGWSSCKSTFSTYSEAIAAVAKNLGGNARATAPFYRGKTTKQILEAYNPPSIAPHYADEVIAIMNAIAPGDPSR